MRTLVRSLILIGLVIWVGGLIFIGAVMAPVAFGSLAPSFSNFAIGIHSAGIMVRDSLLRLHGIGLFCGVVILLLAIIERTARLTVRNVAAPIVLLLAMLGLTAYSQFSVIPRMDSLLAQAGPAMYMPAVNPAKQEFNRLHGVATDLDGLVLLCGLAVIVLYARPEPDPERKDGRKPA